MEHNISTASCSDIIIEELDSNDIPESELATFEETQPIKIFGYLPSEPIHSKSEDNEDVQMSYSNDEERADFERNLIQKFVQGETDFPDIYTKLEPYEEDEDEVADDAEQDEICSKTKNDTNEDAEMPKLSNLSLSQSTMSTDDEEEEGPTTSRKAAKAKKRKNTNMDEYGGGSSKRAGKFGGNTGTGGGMRKRPVLNPALQGLMGEANLSFARGQLEMAEKICLEIVRQNPLAAEPFFTLAEIYESRDTEKFLNFLTIAVHLDPSDRYHWIRIAEMHIAQGNLQRARTYYTRALKAHNRDYDLRLRKAQLLEMMNDKNAAMFAYLKMIQHCPADRIELCLVTAKNVARHFHALSKNQFALEAMESAYNVCGSNFTLEDLNLYMELCLLNKQYSKVLQCLRDHTTLELETEKDDQLELILYCGIPDDYVPDFRVKLCVALIALKAHHLLGYLIQNIHEHIPALQKSDRLNMYCDIAEALMQEHKYAETMALLRPITDGDVFECPPFVWLRHAECLRHLNRCNEAIESYARVVEMAPYCYEAKFTLSALLKQQGRHVEAVKALEQSGEQEGQPLHARLLYERCIMLQQINEIDEFLEVGCVLLGRNSLKLKNREEMMSAANGGSIYNADGLKTIIQMRSAIGVTEDDVNELALIRNVSSSPDDPTIHDEYQLFLELMRTGFAHGKYSILERLCFAMVTTKRFISFHNELERIIILSCYFNDDCAIAFSYLRELLQKNVSCVPNWNLLSLIVQKRQDLRYHRYINRLTRRQPVCKSKMIFMGHYHLHCCSYKYALNVYAPLFKERPSAILALCIGVIFQQISMQKNILRKSAAVAQALTFSQEYARLRVTKELEEEGRNSREIVNLLKQEVNYNIGRIYHQTSLNHLAIEYYEKALRYCSMKEPAAGKHNDSLCLHSEIAYNLHLIYKGSGNLLMARHYLYEYCAV